MDVLFRAWSNHHSSWAKRDNWLFNFINNEKSFLIKCDLTVSFQYFSENITILEQMDGLCCVHREELFLTTRHAIKEVQQVVSNIIEPVAN